jgi:predicted pyridoxine 5'-phosphate oxidase superfamily flavin-nucleotide-binding protein
MFLIPGWGNALRANGRAVVETDEALRASFAVQGKAPRSVIVMTVEAIYFQCARAIVRSGLWDPASHVDPASLPTAGQILAAVTAARLGGDAYDNAWPARAAATLW